jgi:hypothetical protein
LAGSYTVDETGKNQNAGRPVQGGNHSFFSSRSFQNNFRVYGEPQKDSKKWSVSLSQREYRFSATAFSERRAAFGCSEKPCNNKEGTTDLNLQREDGLILRSQLLTSMVFKRFRRSFLPISGTRSA